MSIDAVLNKEILILGFKTGQSKFKEGGYTTVQFEPGRGAGLYRGILWLAETL